MNDPMKPLKPYDDRPGDTSRDHAQAGSYSLFSLERLINDCSDQPLWRDRADLCAAYYDGKQLSLAQQEACRQEKLEPRSTNLIKPVINSVLGQEAKSRTDVKLEADDDAYQDVCDALAVPFKQAERETEAHMAVSNAYGSGVKTGIGWVEVGRNSDPLGFPYRVEDVPRNEIWWDWNGQRGVSLRQGCRWVVRMRWQDLDECQAAMPRHAALLERTVSGWHSVLTSDAMLNEPETRSYSDYQDVERRFRLARREWVDSGRKMVKLYEVWYRVPATVAVLHISPVKRLIYDPKDPRHVEAVARGLVKVTRAVTSQVRMALFAGPHRLMDIGTTKRNFPYYPFFAFRDDETKAPYGLIEGMVAPQDEYNERRLRIQWLLKARQVQMDSDALDPKFNTLDDVADEVMRPDFMAITNPQRFNKAHPAITIANALQLQAEQVTVMQDAKQLIQDTAGRYSSQLGNRPAGVTSGIANSILVEQGEQAMGEMNDNYAFFRRSVFEGLFQEIQQDYLSENLGVQVGSGKTKRVIVLNAWDGETGAAVNMVKDADLHVGLAEAPNTPAYRQQQQQMLKEIITALGNNPPAVAVLAPAFIESSSHPNRQVLADDLRKASGVPVSGDKAGQEAAEAQQAAMLAEQQEQARALAQAEVAGKNAAADQNSARAALAQAQAEEIALRTAARDPQAQADKTRSEVTLNLAKAGQAAAKPTDDAAANEDEMIDEALAEASA